MQDCGDVLIAVDQIFDVELSISCTITVLSNVRGSGTYGSFAV